MEGCAPFDAAQGYAIALTRYVDCQAASLGQDGYAALAAGNSPVIVALGGMLTILIAFQGYRLLLGEQLQVRDAVLLAVKVGLVLAFATQWSAYRSVFYNLTIEAPREMMAVLPGAGGGTGRSFPARLQTNYQAITELTRPSNASPPPAPLPEPSGTAGTATPSAVPQNLPFSLAGNGVMIGTGIMLLISGLAVLVSVRLIAGLLLALGPLFFACFLFDTTRGIFEGWVRALIGTAIASLTTGVLLGVEMSVVESQLAGLIDAIALGTLPVLAPGEILSTVCIFAFGLIVALLVSLRVGAGFRFLERSVALGQKIEERWRHGPSVSNLRLDNRSALIPHEQSSRAAQIADGLRISAQRDMATATSTAGASLTRRSEVAGAQSGKAMAMPLGQTHRRVPSLRRSRSIAQRINRA